MGKIYQNNINPFQDFLLTSLMHDIDLTDKRFEEDIYVSFVEILEYLEENKNDTQYFDYEIKGKDDYFKVVAKNAITALWLSGIFPKNPRMVNGNNEYVLDELIYTFNPKTKKLTYKLNK